MAALLSSIAGAISRNRSTDRFFDEYYFPYNPTTATSTASTSTTASWRIIRRPASAKRTAELKNWEAEFAKLPAEPTTATWC